ncbi:Transcriptional regulator, AbiEi antitoxin, Type IV TA system [Micromonospora auratinigra]|uniref:Transcriptional regulator, AbiEi antitoxin, Type IV TA system n=1 Tax=Micromonospora auratinigra TaxID=261654 RepID=A0A1A9A1F0_9ACTN|nr:Transcriptional regulator, AbiEi antitoxin, Type IV TA system [Micromonospora auratinigra]
MLGEVAAQQGGVVTRRQALAAGYSRHEVDNFVAFGRWKRLARATYLVGRSPAGISPRLSRIRAAVVSLGPQAHAVLSTAAELHGIAGLPRTTAIHVALPGRAARPARAGDPAVVLHQLEHAADAVTAVRGVPSTTAVHTVAELILRERRYVAVSLLDSALYSKVVGADELLTIPTLIRGRRGAVEARGYLTEASGLAQSPLETRTRLRCVDGGVPPDVLQVEVRDDDGYLLGIGDLGWRGPRVIAEADGRVTHAGPAALLDDRRRQNRLVNAGWTVLRFTWSDTLRPDYIPAVVRRAIAVRSLGRS